MTRDRSKDIAVLGVSARFPGPRGIENWWSALLKGEVLTTRLNRDELREAGVPDRLADDPEYIPVRGYLENADRFDNKVFRVSRRDAEMMDPQHRLMLEAAWSALEDAGYGKFDDLPITGVFASGSGSGYARTMLTKGPLEPDLLEQVIHGTEPDFIASLISYKLNLTGPALAVQTACSSSLVGIHLASQALRNGDCDQAIVVAAGIAFPQAGYLHIPGGINSGSGICRPFDKNANGVVEGSGAACVVLRRLEDVPDDAPELHGVILGTAINNDGAVKAGYFAPSISGQIAVIQGAVRAANVDAASIGYLETHGTGTYIGDPIEWTATSEAYKELGAKSDQIAIGALKANVGHLDATSGLASLIKAMRVVKEGKIPPLANFESLNPYMDTNAVPLSVPNDGGHKWPEQELRRAAISAFGIGGTNAHVIIEQPPKLEKRTSKPSDRVNLVQLSAADSEALARSTEQLKNYLSEKNPNIEDVSYTLAKGRLPLEERLVVCGRSSAEVLDRLTKGDSVQRGKAPLSGQRPVVFLFPGQGSQYPGMAQPFMNTLPGFSEAIEACLSHFERSLIDTLRNALLGNSFPAEQLNQTEIVQPALFALEYAISTCLIKLGLKPIAVAGHSLGEITAACVAGAYSLEDGVHFVTKRGRSMQTCSSGSMLALNCNEEELKEHFSKTNLDLCIATINTPDSYVISGKTEDISAFQKSLGEAVRSRILKTTRAFHSSLIEPALESMDFALREVEMCQTQIPIALNATGKILEKGKTLTPKYFLEQARQPVYFSDSLQAINRKFPNAIYIDLGPGQILSSMASSLELDSLALSPGRSNDPEIDIVTSLGALWIHGFPINLDIFHERGKRLHLPTYPFFGPKWMAPEVLAGLKQKGHESKHYENHQDKQDKNALPVFERYEDVTAILTALWVELLSYDNVNEETDFFGLGGDSLLITSLIRKVNQTFDIKVPPRKMLSAKTLGGQAKLIYDLLSP